MSSTRKTVAVALACALGATVFLSGCKDQAAATAGGARPPAEVTVVTLTASNHSIVSTLPGRTSAFYIAEVRPQVNGILQKRLFKEGSMVKAGDPLYQIDDAPYKATLKSAEAALAQAQATLVQARADAKRSAELVKLKAVSEQSNDAAQAALKTAQAAVKAAQAQVLSARINLDYTVIKAPITGRVGWSEVTEGALLGAYQASRLTDVQQLDKVYVDLTQSVTNLMRFRRELANGTLKSTKKDTVAVKLLLDDGSLYSLDGELTFTDASVDESTGMVKLRAIFPNPQRELMPGMYVRALLEEGVRIDSIALDEQAVMRDPKGNAYVYVVTKDNKVEQRPVVATRTIGTQWLIDSGLSAGEKVIWSGFQRTRPGASVTPIELDRSKLPQGKPLFD